MGHSVNTSLQLPTDFQEPKSVEKPAGSCKSEVVCKKASKQASGCCWVGKGEQMVGEAWCKHSRV